MERGQLREALAQGDGLIDVAICVDQVIGYHYHRIYANGSGHLVRLGVHPDYQGLGVGSRLLQAGMAWFWDRRVGEIFLYVEERNLPARSLYAQFGFIPEKKEVILRYDKEGQ